MSSNHVSPNELREVSTELWGNPGYGAVAESFNSRYMDTVGEGKALYVGARTEDNILHNRYFMPGGRVLEYRYDHYGAPVDGLEEEVARDLSEMCVPREVSIRSETLRSFMAIYMETAEEFSRPLLARYVERRYLSMQDVQGTFGRAFDVLSVVSGLVNAGEITRENREVTGATLRRSEIETRLQRAGAASPYWRRTIHNRLDNSMRHLLQDDYRGVLIEPVDIPPERNAFVAEPFTKCAVFTARSLLTLATQEPGRARNVLMGIALEAELAHEEAQPVG